MEGTLSARPEDTIVSGQQEVSPSVRPLGAIALDARNRFSDFLADNSAALPAGATVLAAIAAGSQVVEPLSGAVAPVCAGLAAMMAGLMWRAHGEDSGSADRGGFEAEAAATLAHVDAGKTDKVVAPVRLKVTRDEAAGAGQPCLADELQHAAQLAQLTARMSHELRTPLNAVIGFSEVMTTEMFGPLGSQRYQDYAQHIRECGQTLLKSTEDTLAITSALAEPGRAGDGAQRPVPLSLIIEEAWGGVALQAAQQGISLDTIIPESVDLVGDRRVLRQILVNLFQEAVGCSSWQGRVSIEAVVDGDHVRVAVRASGCREDCSEDSLAVCLARTLLELHGQSLMTQSDGCQSWVAEATLERAVQSDFFTGHAG